MHPLARLQREAEALGLALHSVEVLHGDDLVLSTTCPPLTVHTPRRAYSVSKTVTALAVGLLAAEGRLGLDDPVVRHFPEHLPVHPWVAATRVRDLLTMRGPHHATTYDRAGRDWVASWFRVEPTHRPGVVFTYDTSGSHVLAALVERLAGTSLTDFLRPRVLDPLGVSDGFRFLTDPEGVSQGGSGLVCSPRDLLRLGRLLRDGGTAGGERLVPADLVQQMTTAQADTSLQGWGAQLTGGYGHLLWLPRGGGWLMFGMGGQLVHADPDRDLVVVVTGDTQVCPTGDHQLIDLLVGELADGWDPDAWDPDAAAAGPTPAPAAALSWPAPRHDPAHARHVVGRWVFRTEHGPVTIDLDLGGDGGTLRREAAGVDGAGGTVVLPLRYGEAVSVDLTGHTELPGHGGPGTVVVTSGWSRPSTLDVRCAVVGDQLATLVLRVVVHPDGPPTVRSWGHGEAVDPTWTFVATGREA
ncbi:serine hydrolase [Isoptericola halotolerans]|uniref:serine hydrolase domain-containing protein n=1 Tax=Isoptericola halotolerans TaxID=300560 RepID=UPI00388F2901